VDNDTDLVLRREATTEDMVGSKDPMSSSRARSVRE
jgi:hypothetical protein